MLNTTNAEPTVATKPTAMALRLKDKIALIVDDREQLRNSLFVARLLRRLGHPCVVLDNSGFLAGEDGSWAPAHPLLARNDYVAIDAAPYDADWLTSAKLVLRFTDGPLGEHLVAAMKARRSLGLPSARVAASQADGGGAVLKVDGENPGKDVDDIVLPIGWPKIEALSSRTPSYPETVTVLVDTGLGDEALAKAKVALDDAGIAHALADPSDCAAFVEALEHSSVYLGGSREGILTAIAAQRPVIAVEGDARDGLGDPLGAFKRLDLDRLNAAIRSAIKDIAKGADLLKRGRRLLDREAGFDVAFRRFGERLNTAVMRILEDTRDAQIRAARALVDRMRAGGTALSCDAEDYTVFGDFDRGHKAQMNEEELISRFFGDVGDTMIDVGANFGNSLDIFVGLGWKIHAFEPDPGNRTKLKAEYEGHPLLTLNEDAVSDRVGETVAFYASPESTGISGLSAFTDKHRKIAEVETTTLDAYYEQRKLKHVDFLKIDVEGFDKFVLDGFPWERDRPQVVLAEFEDSKTVPLGYTMHDMARMLEVLGYTVYVSEWLPIARYGIAHDWRRMVRYMPTLDVSNTWGNVIGFLSDPGGEAMRDLTLQSVKFARTPDFVLRERRSVEREASAVVAPLPRTAEEIRAARYAKLRRDPHRYFADSHIAPLRTLRFLFAPLVRRQKRAARWAKLRRDPYRYFRDSHFPPFRLLQFLFAPTLRLKAGQTLRTLTEMSLGEYGRGPLDRRQLGELLHAQRLEHDQALAILRRDMLAVRAHLNARVDQEQARQAALKSQLDYDVRQFEKDLRAGIAALDSRFRRDLAGVDRRLAARLQQQEEATKGLRRDLEGSVERFLERANKRFAEFEESASRQLGEALTIQATEMHDVVKTVEALGTRLRNEQRLLGPNNALRWRSHDRYLPPEDLEAIMERWCKPLGLQLNQQQVGYLAHHAVLTEERCHGRLATTIHAALLRSLVLQSLTEPLLEVLEIGTLFGIGSGLLYDAAQLAGKPARLTMIDPLDGYYGQTLRDSSTGVPVTRHILEHNLAALAVPSEDYRVIQRLSTDREAIVEAGDRQYDLVLIDGDHSYEGVAADFELYGPMVKPGGALIFDDYGAPDWPAIQRFVDEIARQDCDWLWIGGEWRTGVMRRKRSGDTEQTADRPIG